MKLSQGGACWSLTPLVDISNPNGANPFVPATSLVSLLSSCQDAKLLDPYRGVKDKLHFEKWLVAMQTRAWRKTITAGSTTQREPYVTTSSTANLDQVEVIPSKTYVFGVTIPENQFTASSPPPVIAIFEIRT